jgi:hypothetical protein
MQELKLPKNTLIIDAHNIQHHTYVGVTLRTGRTHPLHEIDIAANGDQLLVVLGRCQLGQHLRGMLEGDGNLILGVSYKNPSIKLQQKKKNINFFVQQSQNPQRRGKHSELTILCIFIYLDCAVTHHFPCVPSPMRECLPGTAAGNQGTPSPGGGAQRPPCCAPPPWRTDSCCW